jgi:outer membrane protein OmpA-like peptidoglycan-associated protein
MIPLLLPLTTLAWASPVSPTAGLALGQYFTSEENQLATSFEGMGRVGLTLAPWFDLEGEVSTNQGSLKVRSDYEYARSTARLGFLLHATPDARADLFAGGGVGLMWTLVEPPSAMPQDSPNALPLYTNPATVPHLHGGVGMTLWVAGPLHVRADVRWTGSLGGDPTRGEGAFDSGVEWTLGVDFRAAPADAVGTSPEDFLLGDADGDGVGDGADACPDEPEDQDGFMDDDGCPDPDNDGDGVADARDACPDEPEDQDGFEDGDGCADPDNDGDGVPDRRDRCRADAETWNGYRDDDGCPDEPPEDLRRFSGAIDGITFESGNSTIRSSSRRVLEEAAEALVRHPEVVVDVEGHTDNVGDPAVNLQLSQERADAVVRWLIVAGVSPDRLSATGYGETRPRAENATDAGRAENRRVEFRVTTPDEE